LIGAVTVVFFKSSAACSNKSLGMGALVLTGKTFWGAPYMRTVPDIERFGSVISSLA
jgi:hypothetical protein